MRVLVTKRADEIVEGHQLLNDIGGGSYVSRTVLHAEREYSIINIHVVANGARQQLRFSPHDTVCVWIDA